MVVAVAGMRWNRGRTVRQFEFSGSDGAVSSSDVLVAYSDGVTEPENDYGEFGEERLIQLVRANRHLPLERITEIVIAAVLDWIATTNSRTM